MSTTAHTPEPSDRRLLITGVTLGLIGLIAVAIIIYWTFHLKIPHSIPTLADPESSPIRPSPTSTSSPSDSSKGGNLVRKATTTLSSFSTNLNSRQNKSNFSAKITPFSSSNHSHSQKPRFIHIPGQNMRIAKRLPNGAWTFSEPDVRTNRRSTAWSAFDGGGGGSSRQSGFGFGSSGGGYKGIDVSSVSQVSPTSSSFFSHKPRFLGGPGISYGELAAESSLSVNTQGIPAFASLPPHSPYSAGSSSSSPLIKHDYNLGMGPVTCSPMETENPFDSPVTEQMQTKRMEKEEEAQYGFREPEAPPPAYTEKNRVRERDEWI